MWTSPVWDPALYGRYAGERGRPFADLLGRVGAADARTVVDLGCGSGNLTATLLDRWPNAQVRGVDSSPQMIEAAQRLLTGAPTHSASTPAGTARAAAIRTPPAASASHAGGSAAPASAAGAPAAPARPAGASHEGEPHDGGSREGGPHGGGSREGVPRGGEIGGRGGGLEFVLGDVREWSAPAGSVDVIVSNATLQWVPDHLGLLPGFVEALRTGGWLAIQLPGNGDAPSHRILRELAGTAPYATHARDAALRPDVPGPADYVSVLSPLGCVVEAWETTYYHLLEGDSAVLEWVKGTGARPVFQALPEELRGLFEREYGARLAEAYPRRPYGTLLPFRRIFAVARKEG